MIKCFGTEYRFHPLFVLLMLLSAMTGYFLELLTLFGVVLIHELGHVAAAKSFGWRIREVKLLPFGGVAVTEEGANVPAREELIVAIAGPLQNAIMIAFALLCSRMGFGESGWWDYFLRANLLIGLFNLLPIHPLDGGRVLFVALGRLFTYHRSLVLGTRISLALSAFLALGALVPSLSGGLNLNVLAVGLFLFATNWYGYRQLPFQFLRYLMGREAAARRFLKEGAEIRRLDVEKRNTLQEVAKLFMRDKYHLICIRGSRGSVERIVPEQALLQVFFDGNKTDRAVSEVFL
ncbi:M50 family metallopeptidase [Gorillibacterium timonense]|uniref:M50 family metallopeptidase n=1 Tax=Gorillibacterium timonense TaxID=1689269 RepID=UPI000A78B2BB|nr:M50 family metallopeptidase [Gorillibacterium timonense]